MTRLPPSQAEAALPARLPWLLLLLFGLTHTANGMASSSVSPLASFLQSDLYLSKAQLGAIAGAFSLGVFAASAPAGWLVDRFGARRLIIGGQVLVTAFMAVFATSSHYGLILAANTLAGVGYACINPGTNKAVLCCFPQAVRATAMGLKQMGVALGNAAAAAILPVVALAAGWRAGISVIAVAVAATTLLCLAFCRVQDARPPLPFRQVFNLAAIRRSGFLLPAAVMGMAFVGVQLCFVTYTVIFLQERLGYAPVRAGSYLSLALILAAGARIAWGAVSDRRYGGRRLPVMIIIALLAAASFTGLALLAPGAPAWLALALVIAAGVTAVGWNALQMTLVSEAAGPERAGFATGFVLALGWLGAVIGPPAFGFLVDLTGSYRPAWLMLTAIMLANALLMGRLRFEQPAGGRG